MKRKKIENKSVQNKVPPLKLPKTLPALRKLYVRLLERLGGEHKLKVRGVGVCGQSKSTKEAMILRELIMLAWELIHGPLRSKDSVPDSCKL